MSDIFDHGFDAFQSHLDEMDPVSLMNDSYVYSIPYHRVARQYEPPKIILLLLPHGSLKHKTEKAYLFNVEGRDIWLPAARIRVDDFDGSPIVKCEEWLVYKKNLHEYISLDDR